MKRVLVCIAVLAMVMSMCVFATAAEFTSSVTNKPAPPIDNVPDGNGAPAFGVIRDAADQIIGYLYEQCVTITSVSDADDSDKIPDAARDLLLEIYAKLLSGEMKLPYELIDPEMNAGNMVIRDLFDASLMCEDHPELLSKPGNTVELTFNLGVAAGEEVVTMVYVDGQWKPIVSTVNNGDGTVTCVFEELCPVAFSVRTGASEPEKTGDISSMPWLITGAVALVALVAVTFIYRENMKKRSA